MASMRRSTMLATLGTALVAPGGTVCAQELTRVGAAGTPIEGDALLYLAQSEGYFKRAGLDVDVRSLSSGEAIAAAIAGGDIALGSMNTVSLASAHLNGLPFKILGAGALYDSAFGGSQIMVAKGAPYKSGADLKGKTIAVNVLKGTAQLAAHAWVDKTGGDSAGMKWIEMPFAAMAAALVAGRIDVGAIAEPWATAARATCRSIGVQNDAIARRFLVSQYVSTQSWIDGHRDAAGRIRAALRQTAIWYDAHRAESVAPVAALTKQDPAIVAKSVRSLFGDDVSPALIQPVLDVAAKYGLIKNSFPAGELIAQV
jgi:NitT/TauT family transport system substrate-binding protein